MRYFTLIFSLSFWLFQLGHVHASASVFVESRLNVNLTVYEEGIFKYRLSNNQLLALYGERYNKDFSGGLFIMRDVLDYTNAPFHELVIRRNSQPDFIITGATGEPPLRTERLLTVTNLNNRAQKFSRVTQHLYIGLPDLERLTLEGLSTENNRSVFVAALSRNMTVSTRRSTGTGEIYERFGYPANPVAIVNGGIDVVFSRIIVRTNSPPPPPAPAGMSLIPAGTFVMGDAFGGEGHLIPADLPPRTKAISSFYMDQYEVTKALWDEVRMWAITNG